MTGLEYLTIIGIEGELALTLTPLMTRIKCVSLQVIQMTPSCWGKFIASLLTIQHGFRIQLDDANIDDESVSTVQSSPHFKVTWDRKGIMEGKYSMLHFSKLSS